MLPLVCISHVGFKPIGPGWSFTNRSVPFWRLYHDFDAGAAIEVDGGRIPLDPGTIVAVPAGCMFTAVPPRRPVRHLYLHFTVTAPGYDLPGRPFSLAAEASLRALLGDGGDGAWDAGDPLRGCALACRALSLAPGLRRVDADGDYVRRYIGENLHTRLSLARLARMEGCSPDHFIRRFARRHGITPARYIAGERMALASHLLAATDLPLDEIARRCGFASRGHLSTAFRRATGCTPAAFRAAREEPPQGSR